MQESIPSTETDVAGMQEALQEGYLHAYRAMADFRGESQQVTWLTRIIINQTLDRFLANPTRMLPGTAMTYAGIADPQERADLIAWLRQATASPTECPK